jgi:hypothetical protein
MKRTKVSAVILLATVLALTSIVGTTNFASATVPPSVHTNLETAVYAGGDIINWDGAEGEYTDNNGYTTMETRSVFCHTTILKGEMSDWSIGKIWIRCCRFSGSVNGLTIYTNDESMDDPLASWVQVGSINVTSDSFTWEPTTSATEAGYGLEVPKGYAETPFKYIAIVAVTTDVDGIYTNHIYVDAVASNVYSPLPPYYPPSFQGSIYFPTTFNIQDTNGNPLGGEIYLDGTLIGYTSATVDLLNYYELGRPYQLSVTAYDANYVFQYFIAHTGETTTYNPTPFCCIQPAAITAVYAYTGPPIPTPTPSPTPSSCQLTVYAVDQYGNHGSTEVYIDGSYVGTSEHTYTVSIGNHQIQVSEPQYGAYFVGFYYNGAYIYTNPATISVTSSSSITAGYNVYYY